MIYKGGIFIVKPEIIEELKSKENLKLFFEMLYPEQLEENEYIRMLAMRKGEGEKRRVSYVRSFDEFVRFIAMYRYGYDVYCQLATNLGKESGSAESQYRRKVLFLDFDLKDYPEFKEAHDVTAFVHDKLPKLFIQACVFSGHGYHLYISINEESTSCEEVVNTNKALVSLLGADPGAASSAQISRPPYTYNHKCNGDYDYKNSKAWESVKSVVNSYNGPAYHPLGIYYINQLMKDYNERLQNKQIMEAIGRNLSDAEGSRCYYCIQKVLEEGADASERNTWHGRIVKYLQLMGKGPSEILSICLQWNKKCRPPKLESEIIKDTEAYMSRDYNLLGCYESILDERKREIVEKQCDKYHCKTHQKGISKKSDSTEVAIPISILTNMNLREISGYAFLLITILYIHKNQKMTVKGLKSLLGISQRANNCMSPRVFNNTLSEMIKYRWIELTPHREKAPFSNCEIKLLKKVNNTPKGNILLYHSVAQALILGEISQTDYRVYLTMKRNLTRNRCVTHEQIASDLDMDTSNIGKYIRHLIEKNCLLREANYCGNLRYSRYSFPCPEAVKRVKNKGYLAVVQEEKESIVLSKEIESASVA